MAGRNTIVPDVVCRIAVAAGAADFNFLHRLRQIHARNIKPKSGIRLICLLVPFLLSTFVSAGAAMDHELRKRGTSLLSAMAVGDRASAAITVVAAGDGSASPALPPVIDQAPPAIPLPGAAVPLPGAVVPPSDGSEPPALPPFITQASPAVPLSGAAVLPSDGSAPPALPPFIDWAPPATETSAPTNGGGSFPALPP